MFPLSTVNTSVLLFKLKFNLRVGGEGVTLVWHSPRLTKLTHSTTAPKNTAVTVCLSAVKGDMVKTIEQGSSTASKNTEYLLVERRRLLFLLSATLDKHRCFCFAWDLLLSFPGCLGLARLVVSWQPGREEFMLLTKDTGDRPLSFTCIETQLNVRSFKFNFLVYSFGIYFFNNV